MGNLFIFKLKNNFFLKGTILTIVPFLFYCNLHICKVKGLTLNEIIHSTMKIKLTLFIILTITLQPILSQIVYETTFIGEADTIVYITEYAGLVDLCVYETDYIGEAQNTNGVWYKTQFPGQADFKIYITSYEGLADLTICYTDYQGLAGNNNNCSCNAISTPTSISEYVSINKAFSLNLGKIEIYTENFTEAEIHDLNGKKIISFNTNSKDISYLQTGIYIISIKSKFKTTQTKLIIN